MPVSPAAVPSAHVGNYDVLGTLGAGGMGVVYKARDTRLQRTVALKFLSPGELPDRDRILREARAASRLDHVNVGAIHAVEQAADGTWFLVLGYYEGQTLEERLRDGPLPPLEAAGIAAQIARGLRHAHSHGILHRDVKAANVILTTEGVAKLVDFGLARHFDFGGTTQSASFSGTLAYMSPEQIQGGALDERTDIWSLGVLLFFMLTARLPFQGRSAADHINAVLHGVPAEMHDVPIPLQHVVLRMLAKSPAERYPDCGALLIALDDLQIELKQAGAAPVPSRAGESPAAAPTTLRRALGRLRHARHRSLLLIGGAVTAAALFVVPSLQSPQPPMSRSDPATAAADRQLSEALFKLAAVYESERRPQAADLFRRAAALQPDDWMAHHRLAAFNFRSRDYKAAAAEWRRVIQLDPGNAKAHSNLSAALVELGQLDQAGLELQQSLEMAPSAAGFSNLGLLYYRQKRWAESAAQYEQALNLRNDDYRLWANLGLAYEWLGQDKAAAEAYAQELLLLKPAAAKNPRDATMQSELALLYAKQKKSEPAMAAAQRALALAPDDPLVLSNTSEAYEDLADRTRALELITRSLERGKTLDQLDHNPGLRKLLGDPGFRAAVAQHTRNLAETRH